jgi:hypothetical protein
MFSMKDGKNYLNRSWCCKCTAWHTSTGLQGSKCANCSHGICGACEVEVVRNEQWVRMSRRDYQGLFEKKAEEASGLVD